MECPKNISDAREGMAYGTVTHGTYLSKTTGLERGYNVMLPAGYTTEKKYPVVYFQHGILCDEFSLIGDENNALLQIAGNMVADGLCEEMVVVFPNMYAKTDEAMQPAFNQEAIEPYNNFINDMMNDLIPYIEANYSVRTDRDGRAILGFSMGGRETLFIGLSKPEMFCQMGAISPAPGLTPAKDWAMEHPGQLAEADAKFAPDANKPDFVMICCGTDDKVVGKFPESYHKIFTTNGVEHEWFEVEKADHDANAIRAGFYRFLQVYGQR